MGYRDEGSVDWKVNNVEIKFDFALMSELTMVY
jgi:hypothetical protein